MQYTQLPAKWLKPFAADDSNKVEIPLTSADPTRASQSAGFPPLTMQPPESGGVPPQGEDFNGAMNQVARITWWKMAGGALPFDATWAANAAINGYPQGAVVATADLQGEWINIADNNTVNPDTVGTNWVPGFNYGRTALSGLTNANATLTPAQAAKGIITLAGTLTANIQIIFPNWVMEWVIINNCTGAFTVTCKTAAGSGVVVSQAGGAQIVWGDGTNLNALGGNSASPLLVGTPTLATHAAQYGQTLGRLVNIQVLTASGTYTRSTGATQGILEAWGGAAGGSGSVTTSGTQVSMGRGGGSGAYGRHFFATLPATQAYTIGAGGTGGAAGGSGGNAGGDTIWGALTAPGAPATAAALAYTPPAVESGGLGAAVATGFNLVNSSGQAAAASQGLTTSSIIGGGGAPSTLGGGANPRISSSAAGLASSTRGAGGGSGTNGASTAGQIGGAGGNGLIIVYEYA